MSASSALGKAALVSQSLFPVWLLLVSVVAFFFPDYFLWIKGYISIALGIIMFGMGMSLTMDDFAELAKRPRAVWIGVLCQYTIMPLVAFLLSVVFNLDKNIALGVLLVGCCPGGTASNVIVALSRGNVALSVACTSVSTLLAPLLTPLLFYLFASRWIEVSVIAMFKSVFQIILIPILLGVFLRFLIKDKIKKVTIFMPTLSVLVIVGLVAALVAGSREDLMKSGFLIFLIVILHNGIGLALGYVFSHFLKLPVIDKRAIAVEVGMQNSGLGAALANAQYAAFPIVALPSVIFSFWHNISGSLLVVWWNWRDRRRKMRRV